MDFLFCEIGPIHVNDQGDRFIKESEITCYHVEDEQVKKETGLVSSLKTFGLSARSDSAPVILTDLSRRTFNTIQFTDEVSANISEDLTILTGDQFSAILFYKDKLFSNKAILDQAGLSSAKKVEQILYLSQFLKNLNTLSNIFFDDIVKNETEGAYKHFCIGDQSFKGGAAKDTERLEIAIRNSPNNKVLPRYVATKEYQHSFKLYRNYVAIFKKLVMEYEIPNTRKDGLFIIDGDIREQRSGAKIIGHIVRFTDFGEIFIMPSILAELKKTTDFTALKVWTVFYNKVSGRSGIPISKGLFLPYAECSFGLNALSRFLLDNLTQNKNWFFSSYLSVIKEQSELLLMLKAKEYDVCLLESDGELIIQYNNKPPLAFLQELFQCGYTPSKNDAIPIKSLCDRRQFLELMRLFALVSNKAKEISELIETLYVRFGSVGQKDQIEKAFLESISSRYLQQR